jgi:hypothetical protein
MYLLFTDTHWDDNPVNEYRWQIFDKIEEIKTQYPITHTFNLGDAVDRKDRFTGAFVNRLFEHLKQVAPITILRGNHDTTLRPPNYFDFMSEEFLRSKINYVAKPVPFNDGLLLLPFSAKPKEDWKGLNFRDYKAVFMHATVTGAIIENGQVMENRGFPMIPGDVKFYSGDVHVPQDVRNITYVGCPYPIKFGDRFPCRILLLDEDTFLIMEEIKLTPPRKLMVDIRDIEGLEKIRVRQGDQVKIRFSCNPADIDSFGQTEAAILRWAKEHGVTIAGTEVIVGSTYNRDVDTNQTPEMILRRFAEHEGLTEDMLGIGLILLKEM